MIYIISNVEYPESNKITPQKDDLLVFLNKARSISYYKDHENKIIFRRKPDSDYGSGFEGTKSYFVFDGPSDVTIPSAFITELKQNYDWKYDIEKGRKRCATTGYMVVKYIESQHPGEPITLVNFGYEVKNSTYRCPWHNWLFEANELRKYNHIFTAEVEKHTQLEIVYCSDQNYLDKVNMSAKTVLKHNPFAHITVVSSTPLKTQYDNVVVDVSGYKFRHKTDDRLSDAAYLKLFLPECLNYKKIIYLDGDTICRGSLEELNNIDIDYIGICHSHEYGIKQAEEIGVSMYALDAVMTMDLEALKRIEFTKFAMYAMEHFKFPKTNWYCDETILNCCFHDRLKFIDLKWDFCVNRYYHRFNDCISMNNAVILHFIGGQSEQQKIYYQKEMKS